MDEKKKKVEKVDKMITVVRKGIEVKIKKSELKAYEAVGFVKK